MAINFGDFKVDPETGEYHRVVKNAGGNRPPRKSKPPRSKGSGLLICILVTLVFGLLYYYFQLPAINIHSGDLYVFIIMLCAVFFICEILTTGFHGDTPKSYINHIRKKATVPFFIVCGCAVVILVGSLIGWQVFRARSYASLITVEDGDFASEVAEISFDQIPMLDKASANVLANRKLGELSDLVSQFEVYGDSYQINYKNKPVRVTYLYYGDFFKWFNNQRAGIPAYMVIDMVTQEVSVTRLENGIRYSPAEYFFRDISRYLRFKYPTKIFSDVNFEIDEDGDPYWVATVITKKVGLFGGADVVGAVLVNAVTGESTYYDVTEVPTWVDRVYTSELILQQYDYHGLYQSGFLNSLFGQSGCTETTAGYNYIAQDDDVWVYTGITSVSSDQGNIGFILVNQRTKEANYYSCAGAEEYSAMDSAQGAVQQYEY
ncbi:MAG: CvpA family protein, partial [Clostridia bacterium]|nr:CvpA family protein [Clostridia bacterium]